MPISLVTLNHSHLPCVHKPNLIASLLQLGYAIKIYYKIIYMINVCLFDYVSFIFSTTTEPFSIKLIKVMSIDPLGLEMRV